MILYLNDKVSHSIFLTIIVISVGMKFSYSDGNEFYPPWIFLLSLPTLAYFIAHKSIDNYFCHLNKLISNFHKIAPM